MRRAHLLSLALSALCASCAALNAPSSPPLANAHSVPDLSSYRLRRVGLLPFNGKGLDPARSRELQESFLFELAGRSKFEVVLLTPQNLAEVDAAQPYERGVYTARSILDISERFRLDGLLVGTVTQMQVYSPQLLGMQLELVAAETGLVIWSSECRIDGADSGFQARLARYQASQSTADGSDGEMEVTLLSPARLMRFAAAQVAATL